MGWRTGAGRGGRDDDPQGVCVSGGPGPWLPDWRDLSAYPQLDCEGWSKAWRWEFIRRNPEYSSDRERWNTAAHAAHNGRARANANFVDLSKLRDPAQHQKTGALIRENNRVSGDPVGELRHELSHKWGLVQYGMMLWPSPAESQGWQTFVFPALAMGIIDVGHRWNSDSSFTYDQKAADIGHRALSTSPTTVWLSFDLGQHIGKQLSLGKTILEELQSDPLLPKFRTRDPDVIRRVLRTYDAVMAKTKRAEIATVLHPRIKNSLGEMNGTKQVKDDFGEAKELLDFGFRRLYVSLPAEKKGGTSPGLNAP